MKCAYLNAGCDILRRAVAVAYLAGKCNPIGLEEAL